MDLSKYQLEKLMYPAAGIIPGFAALLTYRVAQPKAFTWFFSLGFLGYRTKVGIVLLTALLIGKTLTSLVGAVLGGIGGAIGVSWAKPPHAVEVAPWRNPTWRAALSKVLPEPLKDTQLWQEWFHEWKLREIDSLLESQRPLALAQLQSDRLVNQGEDAEWARWYRHYHKLVLAPPDEDVLYYVHRGLSFNLQVAALYVLISLFFVPALRTWWCILPASFWAVSLVGQEVAGFQEMAEWWSTFDKQITYLTEIGRRSGPSQANLLA